MAFETGKVGHACIGKTAELIFASIGEERDAERSWVHQNKEDNLKQTVAKIPMSAPLGTTICVFFLG